MAVPGNPQLTALFLTDVPKAVEKCRKALEQAEGNKALAAQSLGVSKRTLFRWISTHPEIDS